jgi:hypothetical protein
MFELRECGCKLLTLDTSMSDNLRDEVPSGWASRRPYIAADDRRFRTARTYLLLYVMQMNTPELPLGSQINDLPGAANQKTEGVGLEATSSVGRSANIRA